MNKHHLKATSYFLKSLQLNEEQLTGQKLSDHLGNILLSFWFDTIAPIVANPDQYDIHMNGIDGPYRTLKMTPGADVINKVYDRALDKANGLQKRLNNAFNQEAFELNYRRSANDFHLLVAFKGAEGGIFQCIGKTEGGSFGVVLRIPNDEEMKTTFESMAKVPTPENLGMEDELEADGEMNSYEDDIPEHTPELDAEEDSVEFEESQGTPKIMPIPGLKNFEVDGKKYNYFVSRGADPKSNFTYYRSQVGSNDSKEIVSSAHIRKVYDMLDKSRLNESKEFRRYDKHDWDTPVVKRIPELQGVEVDGKKYNYYVSRSEDGIRYLRAQVGVNGAMEIVPSEKMLKFKMPEGMGKVAVDPIREEKKCLEPKKTKTKLDYYKRSGGQAFDPADDDKVEYNDIHNKNVDELVENSDLNDSKRIGMLIGALQHIKGMVEYESPKRIISYIEDVLKRQAIQNEMKFVDKDKNDVTGDVLKKLKSITTATIEKDGETKTVIRDKLQNWLDKGWKEVQEDTSVANAVASGSSPSPDVVKDAGHTKYRYVSLKRNPFQK